MTLLDIYLDSVLVESHSNVTAQQTFTGAYGSVTVTPTAYKDTMRTQGPGFWIEAVDDVDCQIWSIAANAANGKRFDHFGARFVDHVKYWIGPNESSATQWTQWDERSDATTQNNPYSGSVTHSSYHYHDINGPVEGESFLSVIWQDPNDSNYTRTNREVEWLRVYFVTTHVYTGLLIRNGAGTGLLRGDTTPLPLVDA